jgi:protein SCO1/2
MKRGIPFYSPSHIIPLLLVAALLGCQPPEAPRLQAGTLVSPPMALGSFELVDQHGDPFGPQNLAGRWTFVFFGYTHCPDVCPTALAVLGRLISSLEEDRPAGSIPRGLFISVDPQRDSPRVLAEYVPYFHPDLVGATGDPDQIDKLTRQLGIFHARSPDGGDSDYLIDHSAALLLFDPAGQLRALFSPPHDPALIAADFDLVREYYEASQ